MLAAPGLTGEAAAGSIRTAGATSPEVQQQYATFQRLNTAVGGGRSVEQCWLSTRELEEGQLYRNEKRRVAWFYGRVAAKQLIASAMRCSLHDPRRLEIFTRNAAGQSVRPEVLFEGERLAGVLSLSHTDRAVLAAWSIDGGCRLGVDLAEPAELSTGFLTTWFTEAEQLRLRTADSEEILRCWALKEAVYKALNDGEAFRPQAVEVHRDSAGREVATYRGTQLRSPAELRVFRLDGQTAVVAAVADGTVELN